MIFWLGKHSRWFRQWYFARTNRWRWGLVSFLRENSREAYRQFRSEFPDLLKKSEEETFEKDAIELFRRK
jgi:hypothetical protein